MAWGSARSPWMKVPYLTFSFDPVERLSKVMTWNPFLAAILTKCEPMKPAPPVTSSVLFAKGSSIGNFILLGMTLVR